MDLNLRFFEPLNIYNNQLNFLSRYNKENFPTTEVFSNGSLQVVTNIIEIAIKNSEAILYDKYLVK